MESHIQPFSSLPSSSRNKKYQAMTMMTNQKRIAQEYYNTSAQKPKQSNFNNSSLFASSNPVLKETGVNGCYTAGHMSEMMSASQYH